MYPDQRAKAVAAAYLASLGIKADLRPPATARAGDTSTWFVAGRVVEVRS
jgi:hypothetical protein